MAIYLTHVHPGVHVEGDDALRARQAAVVVEDGHLSRELQRVAGVVVDEQQARPRVERQVAQRREEVVAGCGVQRRVRSQRSP